MIAKCSKLKTMAVCVNYQGTFGLSLVVIGHFHKAW